MGRRGRSFFGFVLVGAGAVALYLWRNRCGRDWARVFWAPASDCLRDFFRRALRHQADTRHDEAGPKRIVTGLSAPEARPLTTPEQLLSWSPDPTINPDPDELFCRTYNAPLLLPAFPTSAHAATTTTITATSTSTSTSTGAQPPILSPAAAPTIGAASTATPAGAGGLTGGVPGPPCPSPSPSSPPPCRLLVCHDMMGGYLDDRFVQGAADPGAFRLWQWDQIDVFIYFSHHMVTLPPPGWTAAAHRNGVRVLGTLITEEWMGGRARCESALFASPAAARRTADQLAALAAAHGFDGWLINIENGMRRETVEQLLHFVGHLRARLQAEVGPQAMVVWYDAVTTEGRLAWQDGLTRLNAPFFDAADALFVNYKWRADAPAAVAAEAGSRAADVFMGVDVFGRGSYGGGKDNCPVALSAARSCGLSVALFAPGWVYEEFDRASFEQRQEAFWAAIRAVWSPRPAQLQRLPLCSSFNCGAGRAVWLEGQPVSAAPWHNLAATDLVASTTPLPALAAPAPACPPLLVRTTQQLAFCGGSCLAITAPAAAAAAAGDDSAAVAAAAPPPPPPASAAACGPWVHTLYTANVPIPAAGLDVSYTAASVGTSRVAVLLRLRAAVAAATASAGGGGGSPAGLECGVAVGTWGPGDKPVVEALRRQGFVCVSCPATPTAATTCPLADPLGVTSAVPMPATTAAAAALAPSPSGPAIPAGLPWVSYSAYLPYQIFQEAVQAAARGAAAAAAAAAPSSGAVAAAAAAAAAASGVTLTSVGIVAYRAAVAGGPVAGLAPGAGAAAAGGRSSARTSGTGYAAAATAAAVAAAVSAAMDSGGERTPYKAFLGRMVVREHCPTRIPAAAQLQAAAAAAAAAADPLAPPGVLAAAAASPPPAATPLARGRCCRVRWGRPAGSGLRSLRSSFNSLNAPGRAPLSSGVAAAAAAAAGTDPRVSDDLLEGSDEVVESPEDDLEEWEQSSNGAATAGGSPVKVDAGGVAAAAAAAGGGGGGGGGSAAGGGDDLAEDEVASCSRLLTCEMVWEPQFDVCGSPRHRSYHVWAHFNKEAPPPARAAAAAGGSGGGGGVPLPGVLSPTRANMGTAAAGRAAAAGGRGVGGGLEERDAAWELLHPDWSGAVWAGEAFVARYRLVQLEVPSWAASVTLLVQPVGWAAGEAQQMQPLACLTVP